MFVASTVISPDEMNLNFSTVYDAALNRSGGTMTGTLTGTSATFSGTLGVTGATTLGSTLGVTGAATLAALSATTGSFSSTLGVSGASTLAALSATTGSFSSTLAVTGAATLTSTLAVNSTSASAIDVAGGINAGSGNVGIVDTSGKIPAISSTFFASLSGANLTGILESAITDSTILARVASNETISGTWSFSNLLTTAALTATGTITSSANTGLNIRPGSGNSGYIQFTEDGVADRYVIGISAGQSNLDVRIGTAAGSLATRWEGTGNILHQFGIQFSNTISPTALSTGNNNNYNPTSLGTAFLVRLDGGAGSPVLTGLAGGATGRMVVLCHVAGSNITVSDEDANSTAANRFLVNGGATLGAVADGNCMQFIYDGTSSRWRNISVTQ